MASSDHTPTQADVEARCEAFREMYQSLVDELSKVIVGHREIIDGVLSALFIGGNVLLEGAPGLGKTLLIKTLSDAVTLDFSRIQFTPDLMPSDIIGTNIVTEDPETGRRGFEFQSGPIFAQIVLADEINRATPKSQSALLEAMQEHAVTVAGERHVLKEPFFVLATQNPIEQEGTYPLPEAQLDRFLFKLDVGYSNLDQLMTIMDRTTGSHEAQPSAVIDGPGILDAQQLVREVVIAPHVQEYAARLVLATHPEGEHAPEQTTRYVRVGSSPRAAQSLVLGAKVRALIAGRFHAGYEDVREVAMPALRHRLIMNFEAEADGMTSDSIVRAILESTPTEPMLSASR